MSYANTPTVQTFPIVLQKQIYLTSSYIIIHHPFLVGGFNPFEKYARQNGFIFPNFRGENKKYLSCHHLVIHHLYHPFCIYLAKL